MSAEAAARHLLSAYRNGTPVEPLADATPQTTDDAYVIQSEVLAALGETAGAFKIGRPDADTVPIYAPIRASSIFPSGTTLPDVESRLRGVELEVAFRLKAAPPAPDAPDFDDALAAAVVALPVIEIVEARLAEPDAADPLWKLADNQANGALVYGDEVSDWKSLPLAAPKARLTIGGASVFDKVATAPGGDPFASFAAFARVVGQHCGGLKAGQIVICGSLTGVDFAKAGDAVEGTIDGLGTVTAAFA